MFSTDIGVLRFASLAKSSEIRFASEDDMVLSAAAHCDGFVKIRRCLWTCK